MLEILCKKIDLNMRMTKDMEENTFGKKLERRLKEHLFPTPLCFGTFFVERLYRV